MQTPQWAPIVVLVDADYLGQVATDLAAHFSSRIGRTLPQADLCRWLNCIALDSGIAPGANRIQAVFIHKKESQNLSGFTPSNYASALNAQAFKDHIAEFELLAYPVEDIVSFHDFFVQSFATVADAKEAKRVIAIADAATFGEDIKRICADTDGKQFTVFSMQSLEAKDINVQILGYSLLSALGIKANELK